MTETLYDHKWMDLNQDQNGEAFITMGNDAVMLVPLTQHGDILFIKEKSIAYQMPVLTLPTGAVGKSEMPDATANRELQEEIGYCAKTLTFVGTLHPAIKYMQWQCHVFLATDLVKTSMMGDETTPIDTQTIPPSQINKLIKLRKLSDAITIAAIYLAQPHLTT